MCHSLLAPSIIVSGSFVGILSLRDDRERNRYLFAPPAAGTEAHHINVWVTFEAGTSPTPGTLYWFATRPRRQERTFQVGQVKAYVGVWLSECLNQRNPLPLNLTVRYCINSNHLCDGSNERSRPCKRLWAKLLSVI